MKKLKTIIPILSFFMAMIFLQGCINHIDRTGFLPPVKIQIPNKIKKDTATVNFIRSYEKVINELSDKMEYVALNGKEILNKKDQDLTVMDKIKMTKLSVQFMSAGSSLVNEMEKIQRYIDQKQKKGISKMDLEAYGAVEKAIEKRINQLNKKYKKLID